MARLSLLSPGAQGEADAQNITVLAMWMIEHPGTEDEHDDLRSGVGGDGDSSSPGATACGGGGKSMDRGTYLCSLGDISSADAAEMEEGFSERYSSYSEINIFLNFNSH